MTVTNVRISDDSWFPSPRPWWRVAVNRPIPATFVSSADTDGRRGNARSSRVP